MGRTFEIPRRSILAGHRRSRADATAVAMLLAAALAAGCGGSSAKLTLVPDAGPMGVARLTPKNGSTVRGFISFTQRGGRVEIAGTFVELMPGPHSVYIHSAGSCSSPNAASAGPVWNVEGAPQGANRGNRAGDLPQLIVNGDGGAVLQTTSAELSVGTGNANDVIGHTVVVHAAVDPNPKAEFGVPNGWLACGVIERSTGLDLKKIL